MSLGQLAASAISSVVGLASPSTTGDAPVNPVSLPTELTLLGAARRETVGTTTTANATGTTEPAGTVPAASADPAPSADPAAFPPVVAVAQTPLLQGLQNIPIIGPLFVTPIIGTLHTIPLLSDILHPFIGYPVLPGAPGTPQARDVKITSFDGAQIYTHFMPAAGLTAGQKAPTILMGPGLGMPGATNLDGTALDPLLASFVGQVGIGTLRDAGYNVVTWDPRGEFNSGGILEVDHPDYEGRDTSAIISWVAQQPEAQLDGPGDPRMGMVGASYGGGIQLATAPNDHRIDALVPSIAWHSLNSSLYTNGTLKSSWDILLSLGLFVTGSRINDQIYPGVIYGLRTTMLTQQMQDLIAERGPGDLVSQITAPTLLIQGTVDTLFSLDEADENAKDLAAAGTPVKVLWFCGGHGFCATNPLDLNQGALIQLRTMEWLDKYVKQNNTVDTGPQFEWVDQHGQRFSSNTYPVAQGTPLVASTDKPAVLPLIPVINGSLPGFILGVYAGNALNLPVAAQPTTTYIVGAPQLSLTYSGTGTARHVYAQLVDDSTGLTLGSQATPIPVTLDGNTHTLTMDMEQVAFTLAPGQTVRLQLISSAGTFVTLGTSGTLNVSNMAVTLPTAPGATLEGTPLSKPPAVA